jgi:hypothetical protein
VVVADPVGSNDVWFVVSPKTIHRLGTVALAFGALCYFGLCGDSADVLWLPSFLLENAPSGRILLENLLRVLWIVCGFASALALGLLWANHHTGNGEVSGAIQE